VERPTVLIIDDSPTDLAIQEEALRGDYRVICVKDPEEAFTLIRSGTRPDLVLLDILMPGADGRDVCRRLKADAATATVPVIFVTSRDASDEEEAGFAAGAVDYVAKPVNPRLLVARVQAHVELKRSREALERQNDALKETARMREEVEQINRHDLKNPLMVILNVPSILRHQPDLTAEQSRWLGVVETEARRMIEMINRSIDLLKMEKGIYPLKPERVDALAVARAVTDGLAHSAGDGGVTVRVLLDGKPSGPSDTFPVQGEEPLLYSMMANLVKNAIEAAPAGSTVSVTFRNGGASTFSVHNEGVVPESIRGRFFEKFVTAGKPGGTGLGAYSARLIATTLGGSISCASSSREGTTLTVTLPRHTG